MARARTAVLAIDTHAHVLPALDNGPETLEESIALLRDMASDGVRKVVATPHIMGDFYRNSTESILRARDLIAAELRKRNIAIELEVAAEYYLDVSLIAALENKAPLLDFEKKYLIFETSVVGIPPFLSEAIKQIKARELVPVLAHPERYYYLQNSFQQVLDLHQKGVLFQVSLLSLQASHQPTRLLAERLFSEGLVAFVGSNVHNQREWGQVREILQSKSYKMFSEQRLSSQKAV